MEDMKILIKKKEYLNEITEELSDLVNDEDIVNSMTKEELIVTLKFATEFIVKENRLLVEVLNAYIEMIS